MRQKAPICKAWANDFRRRTSSVRRKKSLGVHNAADGSFLTHSHCTELFAGIYPGSRFVSVVTISADAETCTPAKRSYPENDAALVKAGAPVYTWEYGKLGEWVEKAYKKANQSP